MISIFKNYIDKRVDERVNEIISDDTFELRDISDREAKQEMSSFILQKKNSGITKLSTMDFVLNLRIPSGKVEKILEEYKKEKKVQEIK
jgi:hypothetical protein